MLGIESIERTAAIEKRPPDVLEKTPIFCQQLRAVPVQWQRAIGLGFEHQKTIGDLPVSLQSNAYFGAMLGRTQS